MDERAETENKECLWWNIKEEPRQPRDAFVLENKHPFKVSQSLLLKPP